MEVKEGSAEIAILIKMRLLGAVVTRAVQKAQYGTPSTEQFTLLIQSIDKTTVDTSINFNSGLSTADALYFTLPASLFVAKNIVLRCALKFQFDTVIDHAKQNFEIKVTDPVSPSVK